MRGKCDILILTATFGSGHASVAQAVKEQLRRENKDINILVADIFRIINPELYKSVYKGYELLVRKNSKLYNYFYYKKNCSDNMQVEDVLYNLYLSKFASYIFNAEPGLIISTFPMCSGFVSRFKIKYKNPIPFVTFITDIVDGTEWICPYTEKYYVGSQEVKDSLCNKGIDNSNIMVTGIPVRKGFLEYRKDRSLMSAYGIGSDDFVVMLMGGGLGLLPEEKEFYCWLNGLEGVKVLVLAGKNRELYKKLDRYNDLPNIRLLKYVDNVHNLMSNSDLLVTKAGGITVFEAIASRIPIIAYRPMLGQEIENSKFICSKGIGSSAMDFEGLKLIINKFLNDPWYRYTLKCNINRQRRCFNMSGMAKDILSIYRSKYYLSYYEEKDVL